MKKLSFAGLLLFVVIGCGKAPEPTGPAAEATTQEIEVTMPDESSAPPAAEPTTDAAAEPAAEPAADPATEPAKEE